MNIIIIDHEPYAPYKRQRYFMDDFQAENISIEFWSVCNVIPYLKNVEYADQPIEKDVYYFKSYKELLTGLKKLDASTVVLLEVWFTWETIKLFWLFKKHTINYIRIDYFLTLVNFFFKEDTLVEKLRERVTLGSLFKLCLNLIKSRSLSLVNKVLKLNQDYLLFLTGEISNQFVPGIPKRSLTYFDVQAMNEVQSEERIISGKYIVFLDINIVSHPDLKREGFLTISPDIYYQKMNLFFDALEKETGYPVVIAAHPVAKYQNNEFGDRMCIPHKTAALVKDSEFVLTHYSLSINFAILANKPQVYIYTDEFLNSKNYLRDIFSYMKYASAFFESKLINIDQFDTNSFTNLSVHAEAYTEYRRKLLISAEYPKGNYEIVKEGIQELLMKNKL